MQSHHNHVEGARSYKKHKNVETFIKGADFIQFYITL